MEELRLTFLIFGAVAIVAILAHGLWTVRKKRSSEREKPQTAHLHYRDSRHDADFELGDKAPDEDFDDLGVGPVRVVSSRSEQTDDSADTVAAMDASTASAEFSAQASEPEEFNPSRATTSSFKASSVNDERSDSDSADVPEPPSFLLRTEHYQTSAGSPAGRKEPVIGSTDTAISDTPREADTSEAFTASARDAVKNPTEAASEKPHIETQEPASDASTKSEPQVSGAGGIFAEQARKLVKRKKPDITKAEPKRKEPRLSGARLAEDQMRIDFDEPEPQPESQQQTAPRSEQAAPSKPPSQEVLVLNVKAPDGKPIPGSALLPSLLTLGFKFGDQDIFHRHVNSNGKGPVLFSLANMFKPGVFDIDNMETFTTQGVSLFMILPIEGDPHQVFNMMHNAARKLADEFGAQVLDGRRSALTKQSLQQYVEKIREFERQRMIKRAN
ncbi:cell division protein ZipA [Lacimicrobium sp. SS2-24]|uniref:cell division protein ZipA n=1 Tax=Lacimicrobium sp. SS2-24 TaxID=2005569 RepID=UPI000B4A5D08|nr:cell division protein ZipA [Lacimicrobium sp. SS2-24]